MPTSALRVFELREVAPGAELSDGTQRVAVALPDSSALAICSMILKACVEKLTRHGFCAALGGAADSDGLSSAEW